MMSRPRLLLHVCCAPCSTYVISKLKEDYDLTCYFYGPNIHPEEEYAKRAEESRRYCGKLGIPFIEGEYEPEDWFRMTKGHEKDEEGGERCSICYRLRLERTAREAKANGFEVFASTLTVSPHKKADAINRIGREVGEALRIEFLEEDFKKKHGFQKSVQMSKEHGLYRQDYCGCVFSKN